MPLEKVQRSFVLAIATLCCTVCNAQDPNIIADLQRSISESQRKLSAIRLMAPAMRNDSPDAAKLGENLALVGKDITQMRRRVDEMESALHESVMVGFAKLSRRDDLKWSVALRGNPLFSSLPKDVQITSERGMVTIKKKGNSIDRPIGPSPCYHVCPDWKLTTNDRAKLRISIPPQQSRGGTPVPYFGLRDANGGEIVLGSLVEDNKEHEILIQCVGTHGLAFYDGHLADSYGVKDLVSPLYIFFHMNDTSELRIHDFQSSELPGPN